MTHCKRFKRCIVGQRDGCEDCVLNPDINTPQRDLEMNHANRVLLKRHSRYLQANGPPDPLMGTLETYKRLDTHYDRYRARQW